MEIDLVVWLEQFRWVVALSPAWVTALCLLYMAYDNYIARKGMMSNEKTKPGLADEQRSVLRKVRDYLRGEYKTDTAGDVKIGEHYGGPLTLTESAAVRELTGAGKLSTADAVMDGSFLCHMHGSTTTAVLSMLARIDELLGDDQPSYVPTVRRVIEYLRGSDHVKDDSDDVLLADRSDRTPLRGRDCVYDEEWHTFLETCNDDEKDVDLWDGRTAILDWYVPTSYASNNNERAFLDDVANQLAGMIGDPVVVRESETPRLQPVPGLTVMQAALTRKMIAAIENHQGNGELRYGSVFSREEGCYSEAWFNEYRPYFGARGIRGSAVGPGYVDFRSTAKDGQRHVDKFLQLLKDSITVHDVEMARTGEPATSAPPNVLTELLRYLRTPDDHEFDNDGDLLIFQRADAETVTAWRNWVKDHNSRSRTVRDAVYNGFLVTRENALRDHGKTVEQWIEFFSELAGEPATPNVLAELLRYLRTPDEHEFDMYGDLRVFHWADAEMQTAWRKWVQDHNPQNKVVRDAVYTGLLVTRENALRDHGKTIEQWIEFFAEMAGEPVNVFTEDDAPRIIPEQRTTAEEREVLCKVLSYLRDESRHVYDDSHDLRLQWTGKMNPALTSDEERILRRVANRFKLGGVYTGYLVTRGGETYSRTVAEWIECVEEILGVVEVNGETSVTEEPVADPRFYEDGPIAEGEEVRLKDRPRNWYRWIVFNGGPVVQWREAGCPDGRWCRTSVGSPRAALVLAGRECWLAAQNFHTEAPVAEPPPAPARVRLFDVLRDQDQLGRGVFMGQQITCHECIERAINGDIEGAKALYVDLPNGYQRNATSVLKNTGYGDAADQLTRATLPRVYNGGPIAEGEEVRLPGQGVVVYRWTVKGGRPVVEWASSSTNAVWQNGANQTNERVIMQGMYAALTLNK